MINKFNLYYSNWTKLTRQLKDAIWLPSEVNLILSDNHVDNKPMDIHNTRCLKRVLPTPFTDRNFKMLIPKDASLCRNLLDMINSSFLTFCRSGEFVRVAQTHHCSRHQLVEGGGSGNDHIAVGLHDRPAPPGTFFQRRNSLHHAVNGEGFTLNNREYNHKSNWIKHYEIWMFRT